MFILDMNDTYKMNCVISVIRSTYPNVFFKHLDAGLVQVLSVENHEDEYNLAEMMCAGNLIQKSQFVCTFCMGHRETCGHLTFTEVK